MYVSMYVCMYVCVKVVLIVATNIPELPGKQRHLTMSKFTINVNDFETAVRLHRLWLLQWYTEYTMLRYVALSEKETSVT